MEIGVSHPFVFSSGCGVFVPVASRYSMPAGDNRRSMRTFGALEHERCPLAKFLCLSSGLIRIAFNAPDAVFDGVRASRLRLVSTMQRVFCLSIYHNSTTSVSSVYNLIHWLTIYLIAFGNNSQNHNNVVYIGDMSKAFYRLDHSLILLKLCNLKMRTTIIRRISFYLSIIVFMCMTMRIVPNER